MYFLRFELFLGLVERIAMRMTHHQPHCRFRTTWSQRRMTSTLLMLGWCFPAAPNFKPLFFKQTDVALWSSSPPFYLIFQCITAVLNYAATLRRRQACLHTCCVSAPTAAPPAPPPPSARLNHNPQCDKTMPRLGCRFLLFMALHHLQTTVT